MSFSKRCRSQSAASEKSALRRISPDFPRRLMSTSGLTTNLVSLTQGCSLSMRIKISSMDSESVWRDTEATAQPATPWRLRIRFPSNSRNDLEYTQQTCAKKKETDECTFVASYFCR
eukprot:gb/GECG01009494.1/.p1 GENE.gb/GECG01009494.1/~~gb/GECG01009494.1/.p1  ORF type:complete len:117 (+),score=4.00 gb/GECG01009494.1/:1-351(+)